MMVFLYIIIIIIILNYASIIEAAIFLYVPFSNKSLIAENATIVSSISSCVCVAVGIKRNIINPLGITR